IIPGSPAFRCRSDPLCSITVRNSWLICGSPGTAAATFSPGSDGVIRDGGWKDAAPPDMKGLPELEPFSGCCGSRQASGEPQPEGGRFRIRTGNPPSLTGTPGTGPPGAARYAFVPGIECSL